MGKVTPAKLGDRFGRLLVVDWEDKHPKYGRQWLCLCDCGAHHVVAESRLRYGTTRSCGCLRAESTGERSRKHGFHALPEYAIWSSMHQRCKPDGHKNYGARGIRVCSRWSSFENFLADMGRRPAAGHSIDRIDVNGHYEPENCRWATVEQQANNTRANRLITAFGRTLTLAQWERESGVSRERIRYRIGQGHPPEEAMQAHLPSYRQRWSRKLTPAMVYEAQQLRANGATWKSLAARFGVAIATIRTAALGIQHKYEIPAEVKAAYHRRTKKEAA